MNLEQLLASGLLTKDGKRPLVLHSGGTDSTLLRYSLYAHGIEHDTVYVDGQQCAIKMGIEREAIRMQNEHFAKKYPTIAKPDEHFSTATLNLHNRKDLLSSQPISWQIGALSALDTARHSCLLVSNLCDDQASQHIDRLKLSWEQLQLLTYLGLPIPVYFPLRYFSKEAVYKDYRNDQDLFLMTWTCQLPPKSYPIRECGQCSSCRHRKATLAGGDYLYWDNRKFRELRVPALGGVENTPPLLMTEEPEVIDLEKEV